MARVISDHSVLKTYQLLTEMVQYKKIKIQKLNIMSLKSYSNFCMWCVFIGHEYISTSDCYRN